MKLDDIVTIIFKNSEGDIKEIDIVVKQLLDNTTEDFYDMLENQESCMSSSCNNESQNFCDCSPLYEDYKINEIIKKNTYEL